MTIVECPNCQASYRLDESQLVAGTGMNVRCSQCQTSFPIPASRKLSPSATPPLLSHDELSRRLRGPVSARSLDATSVIGASQPRLLQGKAVSLVVISGPLKGKVFPVTKAKVSLGRSDTDIVLDDPEVSRRHCVIEVHGNSGIVADLGSTNGTFVDDERIETHPLEHMSEFRIGSTTMVFSVLDKT
ncbi:MAG: FHA domain-containing protein [Acidobacteriota bacterium]